MALTGAAYFFEFERLVSCSQPITYTVGTIDPRFGISKGDFIIAIERAASIWSGAAKKSLFVYGEKGDLTVNLFYDQRQEATVKLQNLGITINQDQNTYNILKIKYDSLVAQYKTQKAAIDAEISKYDSDKAAYESAVQYWNSRGGAPKNEYNTLESQRRALNSEGIKINSKQTFLNSLIDTINATANLLNQLANNLKITADNYNTIGATQGKEFEEGVYKQDVSGREIDIYQYDSREQLVRVLAHELGHALGLDHSDNPQAIMYKLNEGANAKLTPDDIAALKLLCHLK